MGGKLLASAGSSARESNLYLHSILRFTEDKSCKQELLETSSSMCLTQLTNDPSKNTEKDSTDAGIVSFTTITGNEENTFVIQVFITARRALHFTVRGI